MKTTTLKRAMLFGAALLISAPAIAQTTNAVTAVGGPMSAGPGADFRAFSRLASGLDVTVHGCLVQWDWCDVTWRGNRGWVPAATLEYRGIGEPRLAIATSLEHSGLPVVAFHRRAYWNENYSQRYWFNDRLQ